MQNLKESLVPIQEAFGLSLKITAAFIDDFHRTWTVIYLSWFLCLIIRIVKRMSTDILG